MSLLPALVVEVLEMQMVENHRRSYGKISPHIKNVTALADRLNREIFSLQHKLEDLKGDVCHENLSLSHTYREMIYSRTELLKNLNKRSDATIAPGSARNIQ